MRIYQLEVKNFRGIKNESFNFTSPLVCLIGLGDSTKSTILDAIEYTLCPNWFIPIDDSDFTNCDPSENIEITTTIGPVPEEFICVSPSSYGQYLRGWNIHENKLNDEPKLEEGDICVLSIKLTIDNTLAPEWKVITQRQPDGAGISYKNRQKFSISRISKNIDNELSWTRGSSLIRMSKDTKEVESILLEANRRLHDLDLPEDTFKSLMLSIKHAKQSGEAYGINTDEFKAKIDPKNLRASTSTISLHDGVIPFRRMGLGTRRLMSIGLQLANIEDGSILLIDEIEQALEPHRLKHLLRKLTQKITEKNYGQIFMTTHSPSTLEELGAEPIYCVHYDSNSKKTTILKVDKNIQGTIRSVPEAFLSPKVIVCEGPTEIGLLRAFEKKQIKTNGEKYSFPYNKTITVNGEGSSSASQRAYDLAIHNYNICLFIDSDQIDEWKVQEGSLASKGVHVVRWQNSNNTEMQLFSDIPLEHIVELIKIAIEKDSDEQSFLDSINSILSIKLKSLDLIPKYDDVKSLRNVVADRASKNGWYKNISKAESLGVYLFNLENIINTEFYKRFESIQNWVKNE